MQYLLLLLLLLLLLTLKPDLDATVAQLVSRQDFPETGRPLLFCTLRPGRDAVR